MKDKIIKFIEKCAMEKNKKITSRTDLFDEGILDSLGIIMLLTYLQEQFNLEFSPKDLDYNNFKTVEKIFTWIQSINSKESLNDYQV